MKRAILFLCWVGLLTLVQASPNDTFHIVTAIQIKPDVKMKESNGLQCSFTYNFSSVVKRFGADSTFAGELFQVHIQFLRNDSLIKGSEGFESHINRLKQLDYNISVYGSSFNVSAIEQKNIYLPYAALNIPAGAQNIKAIVTVESKRYGALQKPVYSESALIHRPASMLVDLSIPTMTVSDEVSWDLGFFTAGKPDPELTIGVGGLNIYSRNLTNSLVIFSGNKLSRRFTVCAGDAFTIKIFDSDPDTNDFIGKISFPVLESDRASHHHFDMPFDWIDMVDLSWDVSK